jgi:hypothetical protein
VPPPGFKSPAVELHTVKSEPVECRIKFKREIPRIKIKREIPEK